MKTTDSVMREKFEQYMSKGFHDHALRFPECENTQFESGFDVAQDIAEKFYSHSLAEARREWVEEMSEITEFFVGIQCETCTKERRFGSPPDDSPNNLYVYKDLGGCTRCFCKQHMSYYTKEGAIKDFNEKWDFVGYGAKLKSDLLTGDNPKDTKG